MSQKAILNSINQELLRRVEAEITLRRARTSMIDFVRYTKPDYLFGWFNEELCAILDQFIDDVVNRKSPRLLIKAPPRHGKSELVSRRFPAYILGRYPWLQVMNASYSAELASAMNRDVQAIMDSPEYNRIFPNTKINGEMAKLLNDKSVKNLKKTADFVETNEHGYLFSGGVGGYVTVSKAITRLRELNLISSDNLYGNNRTATYYVNTDKVIQIQKMSDDELNTVIVPEKKSKGQKRNPATEKQSPEVINPKSIATKENSNVSELNDNDLPPYNQEDFDINSYFGEPCSNSPYENAPVDTSQISDIPLYVQDITTNNTFTPETVTSIPPAVSNVPAVQPPVQEEEKPKQKRFVKPTLQEITEVMAVKIREKYGSNVADTLINDQAENFLNYYESNGWRVGKNPMKNWHCAIGNWIKNIKTYSTAGTGTSGALIVATAEQSSRPDFDTIYKEVIDIAGKLQNRSNWLSESANKNIMAGVRTFIAEEIKAHWNLYGESDWKNALNVFIFAQKSPLRYLDPNFCKNNGFDEGLYNRFWTGMSSMAPRESDKLTPVEEYIQSEGFQKQVIEQAEQAKVRNDFRQKLKEHQEYMSKKIYGR